MSDFVIFGGGAMATSLAYILSNKKNNVLMWMRNNDKANSLNRYKENYDYLPGFTLPNTVIATSDLNKAVDTFPNWIFAVPSHAVHSLSCKITGCQNKLNKVKILSVIKGFNHVTDQRTSVSLSSLLKIPSDNIAVLSGPNYATELAGNNHSVTVIASTNPCTINIFKKALESNRLVVYPSDDVAGVEISSVLKNIIAITMGIIDGLGFGANTRGAVFTTCMKEALEIGTKIFGAKPETIYGPACLGDAITTAFSSKSRNYLLGLLLAKKTGDYQEKTFLSEGKNNINLLMELVKKHGIEAPITNFAYQIIHGANAYRAFNSLWNSLQT